MTYNIGHRAVYSLNIHLVLVTKYRRKVINQAMLKRLQEIFENTCTKWRSKVTEFNAESDHVHLVISYPPDVEVSKLVNNLKTVSSRLIRNNSCGVGILPAQYMQVYLKNSYYLRTWPLNPAALNCFSFNGVG